MISVVVGVLLLVLFYVLGCCGGWSEVKKIGWVYLLVLLFSGGGDLGNLFYFNFV